MSDGSYKEPEPTDEITNDTGELPTRFGRYEVVGFLGAGGFGAVYEGLDSELQRRVAIKVPIIKDGARFNVERYRSEAQSLAKLRHPGIVAIYDVGGEDDGFYIVTEYLEGDSLHRYMQTEQISWREAASIAAQAAEAIAHAHARRVVHRDIKPANIIMTEDRGPVLVDFGLAIAGQNAGKEIGSIRGTLNYMAPEQVEGRAHRIDGRTDIYALGAVLYELLTGTPPFQAEKKRELRRQIVNDAPQPPRQIAPDIPQRLEKACMRALYKAISRRPTTAADFAESLKQVLVDASQPVSSRGPEHVGQDIPTESGEVSISDSSAVPIAGKRQITALHITTNVVSDPEEDNDAEDLIEASRIAKKKCEKCVERFGGSILPGSGQDVTACFGYPLSYEDAPRRAVDAANTMRQTLQELSDDLNQRLGLTLQTWFSVHSGMVIVSGADQSLVGDPLKLVTKIDRDTEPQDIIITSDTHRLLRRSLEVQKLEETCKLPGQAELELYRVDEILTRGNDWSSAEGIDFTPLVGRDQEVSMLFDRWELAGESMGQIVALIGDAGLGKSRLVQVLKDHVAESTDSQWAPIIEWSCSQNHTNSAFHPVKHALQQRIGLNRKDSEDKNRERLKDYLESLDLDLTTSMPICCDLLSLPKDDDYPALTVSSPKLKELTLQFLFDWIANESRRQPLLFIVEDLHWIDPSTLDFLQLVADAPIAERLMCLMTFRPEFTTPWTSRAHQTQIALTRLTRLQVNQIIQSKVPELPIGMIDRIVERTDGVPLFVEEYAKMLNETPLDSVTDTISATPESTAGSSVTNASIPASLQGLLMARLDRVGGDSNVVRLGAAIGREFSFPLILAASDFSEAQLKVELDKLVDSQLLYRRGVGEKTTYQFKHALIQDAAYDSMLRRQRREIHRKIANALAADFPETAVERPELLAHHYAEGAEFAKAVPLWLQAGGTATATGAFAEATEHLHKGMNALMQLPDSPERDALEYQINVPLGIATHSLKGYATPELGHIYDRRMELCKKLDDEMGQLHSLWAMGSWRIVRDEVQVTLGIAERMMAMADQMQDDGAVMEALFIQAIAQFYHGEFQASLKSCQDGWALFDHERCLFHTSRLGQHAGVAHLSYMALCHWYLGEPQSARDRMQQAIELTDQLDHPFSVAFVLHHASWLDAEMGLGTIAIESANKLIKCSQEQAFFFWETTGMLHRAGGSNCNEDWQASMEDLMVGLARYHATGAQLALPRYFAYQARTFMNLQQNDESAEALEKGFAAAEEMDERFYEPELWRLKAQLALANEDTASATESLMNGVESAKRMNANTWELKLLLDLSAVRQSDAPNSIKDRIKELVSLLESTELELPLIQAAKNL